MERDSKVKAGDSDTSSAIRIQEIQTDANVPRYIHGIIVTVVIGRCSILLVAAPVAAIKVEHIESIGDSRFLLRWLRRNRLWNICAGR